jgi:RHS repeat-associated protein
VLTETDGSSPSHVLKQFSYDSTDATQCPGTSCNGKLSSSTRLNPAPGSLQTTEYYRYDTGTGRPSRRDTIVSGSSLVTQFSGLSFSFSQQYNAIGAVKKVTYPCRISAANGSCIDTPLTVGYNYTDGVLSSIDDGSQFPATTWASSITYQPNGLVADVVHGNGKMHEKWTADSNGMARPGAIAARNGADTSDLWSTGTYQFDGAGNIKTIGNTSYVYDDLQQLHTTANLNALGSLVNATSTNFDPFGNILSTTQSYCGASRMPCGSSTSLTRKVYSAHNHYTDMTYDSAGNVITDGHRTLTYDALGMTSSIVVSGRYFFPLYDAGDERVALLEAKGNGYSRTTYTLRGFGNQLLRSYVDDYTTGTENLFRKEDEIWRGDRLLASDNGSVRHYALDHLGSPRFLVDVNGNPFGAGTQAFSPWGVGGTTNGGMLQFTGQERDAVNVADASGNTVAADLPDDFHARLYDPYEGHFLRIDPSQSSARPGSPVSWNRYLYACNNPLKNLDANGREWRKFADEIGLTPLLDRLSRDPEVKATLARYEGEGKPDLKFTQKDPSQLPTTRRVGVLIRR